MQIAATLFVALGIFLLSAVLWMAAEQVRNVLGTLVSIGKELAEHAHDAADAAEPLEVQRKLSALEALINDIDERTERRYRTISARARRAEAAVQQEEEDSELPELPAQLAADFGPPRGNPAPGGRRRLAPLNGRR